MDPVPVTLHDPVGRANTLRTYRGVATMPDGRTFPVGVRTTVPLAANIAATGLLWTVGEPTPDVRWLSVCLVIPISALAGSDSNSATARVLAASSRRAAPRMSGSEPNPHLSSLPAQRGEVRTMRLSIRNQLAGTVININTDNIMAVVKVALDGGQEVTAAITKEAVENLGLQVGQHVVALIKSTEVMLGVE
jgi:molybdate transport system regulatory protein